MPTECAPRCPVGDRTQHAHNPRQISACYHYMSCIADIDLPYCMESTPAIESISTGQSFGLLKNLRLYRDPDSRCTCSKRNVRLMHTDRTKRNYASTETTICEQTRTLTQIDRRASREVPQRDLASSRHSQDEPSSSPVSSPLVHCRVSAPASVYSNRYGV